MRNVSLPISRIGLLLVLGGLLALAIGPSWTATSQVSTSWRGCNGYSYNPSGGESFTGVWREGSGEQRWFLKLSEREFASRNTEFVNRGLRLHDIEPLGKDTFMAAWRVGTGTQWVHTNMTLSEMTSLDDNYFPQGLRLQDLDRSGDCYTAVWRSGSGAQYWRTDLSWQAFQAQDTQYFDQGLRLVDIEIDDPMGSSGERYTAIWREGDGTQRVHRNMSLSELQAQDDRYFQQGLILQDVERLGNSYTAVWRRGQGAQRWHTQVPESELISLDQQYLNQGLRLVDLEFFDT